MQTYIHLFFTLLMPLTLLFSLASIGYFTIEYPISKAMRIGIISGVLLGISISLVIAFFLLIMRKIAQKNNTALINTVEIEAQPTRNVINEKPLNISKEIKRMLLMDKELTFHVLLSALKKHSEYILSASDLKKGTLNIETQEGIIQTTITSLTKHTSQIILQTQHNVKPIEHIIEALKEKEHSFLQY